MDRCEVCYYAYGSEGSHEQNIQLVLWRVAKRFTESLVKQVEESDSAAMVVVDDDSLALFSYYQKVREHAAVHSPPSPPTLTLVT